MYIIIIIIIYTPSRFCAVSLLSALPVSTALSSLASVHTHPSCFRTALSSLAGVHWKEQLVEVLLYVHRSRRFIRDGSPGRPPRLSHSS